jgi:hypothetical protein
LALLIDNAIPSVAGTDLEQELQQLRKEVVKGAQAQQTSPAEMAQVYLFDLRQPVMMCIGQLPPDGGVSGFMLRAPSPRILRYFCDSLRHRGAYNGFWTRDQVAAPGSPVVIDPIHTDMATAIKKVVNIRTLLETKSVLWSAYVRNAGDAQALWAGVRDAFNRQPTRHLIVVFGIPEDMALPDGMKGLPPPAFRTDDVACWVRDIVKVQAWGQSLVERWTSVIVMGYAGKEVLPVDDVYERLERHYALLNEHRDEQALLQALRELEMIGE